MPLSLLSPFAFVADVPDVQLMSRMVMTEAGDREGARAEQGALVVTRHLHRRPLAPLFHKEVLRQHEILEDVVAKSVRNVSVVDNRPARALAPHGAILDD